MGTSREQIEQREDELAEQEYKMNFADLPGDIKNNIHNVALEEFGLRRNFKFKCLDCNKFFEMKVEGALAEIYTEIQSETHNEILKSDCPSCKESRDKQAEEKEFVAINTRFEVYAAGEDKSLIKQVKMPQKDVNLKLRMIK